MPKTSAIYANLIIGVINVGMTVIAIKVIDRVGRRPMLFAGVFVKALVTETKGRSLEEIEGDLQRKAGRCSPRGAPQRPAVSR